MSVKAGKEIIAALNEVLEGELAAINQYFLHAKMLQNWGYERLYKKVYHESIDEMKHADVLVERILYLDGIPNVQKIGRVRIGETVEEMFACDVALEEQAIPRLQRFVKLCREHDDEGTRAILSEILRSEEEHLDWLETQQTLIQQVGLQAYLAEQIKE
jgi:bacterioferritin